MLRRVTIKFLISLAVFTAIHHHTQPRRVGAFNIFRLLQLHHLLRLGQQHPLLGPGIGGPGTIKSGGGGILFTPEQRRPKLGFESRPHGFRNVERYKRVRSVCAPLSHDSQRD